MIDKRGFLRSFASLRNFDYARCARLAGIGRLHWAGWTALALCTATADAAMLAVLVPLGSAIGGNSLERFWHSRWLAAWLPLPPDKNSEFLWLAGLMFLLACVKNAFAFAQSAFSGRMRTRAETRLADLLFDRWLGFGKAWFDRTNSGYTAKILDYRQDVVEVLGQLQGMTGYALLLSAYLAVMLLISWRLTLIAAILFPLVNLATRFILDRTADAAHRAREATRRMGKHVYEVLEARPLYQAAGQEHRAARVFAEATARLREASLRVSDLRGVSTAVQELTGMAALVAMLFVAMRTDPKDAVEPALLFVFFFVARLCIPAIASFPDSILKISERLPRCRDVLAIFDDDDKFYVPGGDRLFQVLQDRIEFRNLTFAYPGGPEVLRDVSFTVPKRAMTAIVGPSGSGKSTLANLLMCFYEAPPGAVLIDGIDIREYSPGSLRRGFSIVSQQTTLLSDSLRANLLFGVERQIEEARLRSVVEEARLGDVVSMLPAGLDGQVGEHGARLSGGERQRVAIARALLRQSSLLILDEATSNLDAITEQMVHEAISNAVRHSTSLVIAHRFATLLCADRVIVMDEGRVVQQGTVAELLAVDGLFRQMSEKQQFS